MGAETFADFTQIAIQYGIFGALFISLLVYVIRTNEKREKEYQNTIDRLGTTLCNTANDNNRLLVEHKCTLEQIDFIVDGVQTKLHSVDADVLTIKNDVAVIKVNVDKIQDRIKENRL